MKINKAIAITLIALLSLFILFKISNNKIDNETADVSSVTSSNQSVSDNGIEVTLSDLIFDGEYLYVSYVINSDTPFKTENSEVSETELLYDHNEKFSFTDEALDASATSGLEGKFIDDNTFEGVERYNLSVLKAEIPDSFNFEIFIKSFSFIANESNKAGNWNFKVYVSKNVDTTKKIEVNSKNKDGVGVKEVFVTPHDIILKTQHKDNTVANSYVIEVSDKDGNKLEFKDQTWNKNSSEIYLDKDALKGDTLIVNIYTNDSNNEKKLTFADEIYIK